MTTKRLSLKPSEILLPARMSLNLNALDEARFAVLDFPYSKALDSFLKTLKTQYNRKHNKEIDTPLDFDKKPPYRQLNQAIMACCPVLVHAFERYGETRCMVVINRLEREPGTNAIIDAGSQFPDVESLTDLIELWIDHWLENADLKTLVDQTMSKELAALKAALQKPETQWRTDVTLKELIAGLDQDDAVGYNAIPAIVIALLHGQRMTLTQHEGEPITVIWRKAHDGFAKGLHLVSQPFHPRYLNPKRYKAGGDDAEDNDDAEESLQDGYFVYRLDVKLETQVGRLENGKLKPWIFLKVRMRRYADEPFKKDSQQRNISVLLGFNREKILPENRDKFAHYPYDTTLIALPVDIRPTPKVWDNNLAELLSSYGLSALDSAEAVLDAPAKHGNLGNSDKFKGNEYYVIHAEGRKYSDNDNEDEDDDNENKRRYGHGHHIKVGFSLKERTEVIQRALELLPNVLIPDMAFEPDVKAPQGANVPLTLRDYEFFDPKPSYTPEKTAEKVGHTIEAILRAVQATGKDCLDIALLCTDTEFLEAVKAKIHVMFPGWDTGDKPFVRLHCEALVSPALQKPLDPGDLNPKDFFNRHRAKDFYDNWAKQMKAARPEKIDDWRALLSRIPWRPNAHRVALIESYYEKKGFEAVNESQTIKGAIREACSREGIASQLVSHFEVKKDKKLSKAKDGRLETAILDLLLRGTGAIYGTPADLYDRAAGLLPLRVPNLDVVAFWHVQTNTKLRADGVLLTTVIAVRLRADGCTEVFAPGFKDWTPYAKAGPILGKTFADLRAKNRSRKADKDEDNLLRMNNKAVMRFVREVLEHRLDAPTIAVIPANWWRNARSNDFDTARWSQLGNKRLFATQNVLDFSHLPGREIIKRSDPRFNNLLAVIRLRKDSETPQYAVGTLEWDAAEQTGDLDHLSGYVDCTVREPMHYFSIAAESDMQGGQSKGDFEDGYKLALDYDYAYKHAQLVELLPFFVREDFHNPDDYKVLCRCVHFLRVSPAFSKSNILLPYPMHLAKKLLSDLMCIVEAE